MSPRSQREREARQAEWVASGAQAAQERLYAALTAAGVEFNPMLVGVNGTSTSKRIAGLSLWGDEVEQLITALERAALPVDEPTPEQQAPADELTQLGQDMTGWAMTGPEIETGTHPRGGFFAKAGKQVARGDTPAAAIAALRAKTAGDGE